MKIIRPVNVTEGMINENTSYPPSVNEWEAGGYALIPSPPDGGQAAGDMVFSSTEDKLLIESHGANISNPTWYLVNSQGSDIYATVGERLYSVDSEPGGARFVGGGLDRFYIIEPDGSFGFVQNNIMEYEAYYDSQVFWHDDFIIFIQRGVKSNNVTEWTMSRHDESGSIFSKSWEISYNNGSLSNGGHTKFLGLMVESDQIRVSIITNGNHALRRFDPVDGSVIDTSISAFYINLKSMVGISSNPTIYYFTCTGSNRGLYRYDTTNQFQTIYEPSGIPSEPGRLSAKPDESRISVSSGFSSHILDTSSDTWVSGTERTVFGGDEHTEIIPFNRTGTRIALSPKQPDDLGIYNLREVADWSLVTEDQSTYLAGDRVTLNRKLYEALVDTPGLDPVAGAVSNPPQWLFIGATNPWRMFDGGTSTPSLGADIDVSLTPGAPVTGVALLGMGASTVQVTMTDPADGLVYDTGVVSLLDNNIVDNWFQYFFAPYQYVQDFTVVDLPFYEEATVDVAVTNTEGDAAIGELVIGSVLEIGEANFGTSVGIIDYSRKEVDQFGNFQITQRRFSKRAEYDITLQSARTGSVQTELAKYRTTPIVWIGDENRPSTIVYGYYRDFDIILSNLAVSDCSITVEGL